MPLIERKEYLDKLSAWRGKQMIKIVTGVRRCGKSTLMELYQKYLRSDGVAAEQIVAINLEDYENKYLREPEALHTYVKEHLVKGKMTYVFIDEVQRCQEFPEVIDSLFLKPDIDIYLTGSNASLLSGEIATMISGRYIEISMLPLSFREYVLATGDSHDLSQKYRDYISTSSFPYVLNLKDQPNEIRTYLEGLYNTIVVKDISARRRLTDPMILESVIRFVYDNIGNQLSTKRIADALTSYGRKIDTKTVEKYLSAMLDSFMIYKAARYNVKGKQHLKTLEKYYAVDIGLRYYLLPGASDVGHILENVVYLELIRRGYKVFVGKIDDLEIDFVTTNGRQTKYFQVAATVRDEGTLQRELAPLRRINDHYQKFLLTLDEDPDGDYDGIYRINALDWLMGYTD